MPCHWDRMQHPHHPGGGCLYQRFYVISQIYHISLGTASILLYLILIAIQILLLRKVSLQVLLK